MTRQARSLSRLSKIALVGTVTLSLVTGMVGLALPAMAAGPVTVSLTFDDNTGSEYSLAYLQALQPNNVHATFFVKSGSVGTGGSNMSWANVTTLAGDGNDIGGKTVSATNLTTDPDPTTQVCQDRQNLLSHGLTPIAFAYPGGAGFSDSTVRNIVQACGYGNGRRVSGLTSTSATAYAEPLPPVDPLAIRPFPPAALGGVLLSDLQAAVNNANTRGGGWIPILLPSKVCPTASDPGYAACATGSFVGIDVLNSFITWVKNAGQVNQAPAGTTFDTVAHAITSSDTSAPTTTIACNGSACSPAPYSGVVSVTLSATDLGSGISSTHYTTDGTDPTLSSPTYTGAFNVNGSSSSTTVKFRSWDFAGNVEAVQSQTIQAPTDAMPPTTTISCNGSACSGPYVDSVTVTLSATDAGGSGVDKTYYTTDGSAPDTSSSVYSAPFQLTSSATVKFFSRDKAGNAETVQSQAIQVVPHATIVSLTFDNGTVGQYTLAYQQALQPHNAHATFFVNSGNIGASAQIMTWSQLSALAAAGNDIGGKTVSATNLKTDPDPVTQVCQDRQNLISHGLNPIAFAYPGGAFDTTVKNIVQGCGYGNARSAGSLSPSGPTYAETLPPKDWLATRAYAPTTVTLSDMESLVSGAASHGGGWVQIVMTRVCSQSLDPGNYTACTAASSHVELADLISFLDWVQNAGQPNGAPASTSIQTVRDVVMSQDNVAPTTSASCDVGPCSGSYNSVVKVTLSASDLGAGLSSTHYTTDGSTPALSSPTYSKRIAITSPTTLKFRSWDNAGNVEGVQTLMVQATPSADTTPPTTMISCNDASCSADPYAGLVTVKLSADDGSGWGVDQTFYTTDGSTPSPSSPAYSGPIALSAGTYTVKYYSVDFAGNAEGVHSQAIDVSPAKTVVSITFDDGDLNQYSLAFQRGLQPHHMRGTFFINTGSVASGPGFMTWSNIQALAANGQDVGGHTVDHIDLTSSSYTQQQKTDEVCNDRQALIDHGISPTSFAYPFGAYDSNAESIVQGCGYTSGRRTGGIPTTPPPYAETIPPADPFATRTWTAPTATDVPIQLADMKAVVTNAADHGGGWVQIVIHEVCSQTYDASNYSTCLGSFRPMELDTFNGFLDWLQNAGQGGAPAGTVVESVAEVTNGPDTNPPTTQVSCNGTTCLNAGWYTSSPVTVALSATDQLGGSGVAGTYYTTDGTTPTTSSALYTGAFQIADTSTVKFFSTDNGGNVEQVRSQTIYIDVTPPTTSIQCDGAPCQGTYTGTVSVSLSSSDAGGSGADKIYYTTDGSAPTTSSSVYAGPFQISQTTTVRFFSKDVAGNTETASSQQIAVQALDTTPPTTTIMCNAAACSSTAYGSSPVIVALIATDNVGGSGVDKTYYTTNGSPPTTSSSVYTDPFDVTQTTTVRFFSTDHAGNAETAKSQQIQISTAPADTTAPTTTIMCNAAACSSTAYTSSPVTVALIAADDAGGSGVDKTYYTTDGSTPTTSSTVYTAPFDVSSSTTVRFFSTDLAGNAETAKSQQIQITSPDTTAPTTTITCNGGTCSRTFSGKQVTIALTATDNAGGSGVDKTYYTTDGSTPTTSSTVYTGSFKTGIGAIVKFFSTDKAGNIEQVNTQPIGADTTPPATSALCNTAACSTGWYNSSPVTVALIATDSGSGVNKTYYTTNGSTPTTSSTVYSGPFNVSSTTTVSFFSVDNAGNAETPKSVTVKIDVVAPTVSLTSPSNGSSFKRSSKVTLSATASDADSGIANVVFMMDGNTVLATVTKSPYTATWSTNKQTPLGAHTITAIASDNVGNQITSAPVTITITA